MSEGQQPRVAVVALGDPESRQTWSGTTAGLLEGLRAIGVQTHAVDLTLPKGLEQATLIAAGVAARNRYEAQSSRLTTSLRSRLARARLRDMALDGIIQVGTTFALPAGIPYVTLEDMTISQAHLVHPVFARMSSAAVQSWERRRMRIYARARMCAATSHWAADSLVREYRLAPERVGVVGLGANHRIAADASERAWRPARFLFVGLDWERKGGPLLLRAFARLRNLVPDASLDLVGGHPPLEQPGVRCHGVRSSGSADDRKLMADLFARATCFVMPSLVEPFGIVHIEAAAAGIPSIGSSVGGPRDVIAPPDCGLIVDPGDEDGLLDAMGRLSDPAIARRMGGAAHTRAALYTWPNVAGRLLRMLGLQAPEGRRLPELI